MYAIISDRGKQYQADEGAVLAIDLMPGTKSGDAIRFTDVLLTSDANGGVRVGAPTLAGAAVTGVVLEPDVKGKKIDVVHFRAKKDSATKVGHRQRTTRVKIHKIEVAG